MKNEDFRNDIRNSLTFTISEEIMNRINQWDQCKSVDVSGAKLAFTFIPRA